MAKASKTSGAKKSTARPKPQTMRSQSAPGVSRSMQNRGVGDTRKAVQPTRTGKPGSARAARLEEEAVTRVTHETEVRGTETRVERVVERAPKPSLPAVDRSAGRGRYVYCIIRAGQSLRFGPIGMD